jgi:hypothetical protein
VIVEPTDADLVRRLASEHGVQANEVTEKGFFEPVTTLTFVLLGGAAAVGAVVHLLDAHKGGQVIDLRPGAPRAFYRTADLVYGLVVVIAEDGKVTVDVKEPKGMFGMVVEAVQHIAVDLGKSGIEALAAAVENQLAGDVTVAVERATGMPSKDGD